MAALAHLVRKPREIRWQTVSASRESVWPANLAMRFRSGWRSAIRCQVHFVRRPREIRWQTDSASRESVWPANRTGVAHQAGAPSGPERFGGEEALLRLWLFGPANRMRCCCLVWDDLVAWCRWFITMRCLGHSNLSGCVSSLDRDVVRPLCYVSHTQGAPRDATSRRARPLRGACCKSGWRSRACVVCERLMRRRGANYLSA